MMIRLNMRDYSESKSVIPEVVSQETWNSIVLTRYTTMYQAATGVQVYDQATPIVSMLSLTSHLFGSFSGKVILSGGSIT